MKDHRLYIGMTDDLVARVTNHNMGAVPSTKHRRPFVLVYQESCKTRAEASSREKFLKSGRGHDYLRPVVAH
jgi:putative endonuclease